MASKTLVRTGASLVNRFLSNPFLRQSPNPNTNQRIVSQGLDVTPKLFPSLSKFENSLHLPQYQNDAESIRKVASEGFVYPSGLPSLSFYLPEVAEMAKKGKDTHNKITKYEMERAQRIKQNQEKINALGLKHLSTFLPKYANVGRKRVSAQVDDDDRVPAIGDDELSSSLNNEMAPRCSTRSCRDEFTPTVQHKGPLLSLLCSGDSEQEMLRVQDEHCNTPEAQPLTEEEIFMMVLKPRSGYVKGLGIRPSSSLRTPASSSSTQYTQQLEGRVEELQDTNYKLEGRVEELQDANLRPEEKMDCIIQYLRSKGDSDICHSGGSSSTY
uniref:Uncharacterized protein n=1 Tax=Quercus lobata TaxID=97700 RepID=A0A7N2R4A0_QUELO